MKRSILLALLFFSACKNIDISSESSKAFIPEEGPPSGEVLDSQNEDALISSNGIGKAKLGMTIQDLKNISGQDTEFEVVSPSVQDVNAIAVSKNDIVQYYILYPADSASHPNKAIPKDKDKISVLLTNNHKYQTREGVKVGMPIKQAEDLYGNAVLSYKTEGESQEQINFSNYKAENIKFRASYFQLISNGLGFSGIYPEYPGVSYTTDKYHDDAAIAAIEVSCESEDCSVQKLE